MISNAVDQEAKLTSDLLGESLETSHNPVTSWLLTGSTMCSIPLN